MASDWQIGDKIENRWEIHKILKGGMGIVYIVYDYAWEEALAAKTFQNEIFARDDTIAGLFKREALTWINLDLHQNVAQARSVENIDGKPFLFLEYVGGGDLSSWIGTPKLTEDLPQLLLFAIQFCEGMTYAISKGIKAHRDIKPQNCLITADHTLKITDFGLAKIFDETDVDPIGPSSQEENLNVLVSRTGSAAGTPAYMAPEQFDDAKHVDVRADIYSFGIMLFQMLEGRLPFSGRTWSEIARLHKDKSPPHLARHGLPLADLVARCLKKESGQRFGNFAQVREQLGSIYENLTGKVAARPAIGKQLDVNQLYNKGYSLGGLGRHSEANVCYDRAIALYADWAPLHGNKGHTLAQLGRYEEAIERYDRAIALEPNHATFHYNKGVSLAALNRCEEAIVAYDRAIALDANDMKPYFNKAVILGKLSRYEEALNCYDRVSALDPHFSHAHNNRGFVLDLLGRYDEAVCSYDKALALNPNDEKTYCNKGRALAALGRYHDAITCYDRAIALEPTYASPYYNKGAALEQLGSLQEGINGYGYFEQAIRVYEIAYNLGDKRCIENRGFSK